MFPRLTAWNQAGGKSPACRKLGHVNVVPVLIVPLVASDISSVNFAGDQDLVTAESRPRHHPFPTVISSQEDNRRPANLAEATQQIPPSIGAW